MSVPEIVAREAFRRKWEAVKSDIEAGRITFYNPPDVWTEELLNKTALNCTRCLIAEKSKWN